MTELKDEFRGDDAHLISCIKALISMSDAGALVPHGIGGHARSLLSAAALRLSCKPAPAMVPACGDIHCNACDLVPTPTASAPQDVEVVRTQAFNDCIDAIKGCIALGRQEEKRPPEGHWLGEFWNVGRQLASASAQKPVATVRVTHGGYGMELSTHVAYALPEGKHDVYASPAPGASPAPKLTVFYGSMPESNGKSNWTAILHAGAIEDGITLDRSEYPDRVRYEADRARYLIGELAEKPCIVDYDADKHSGYVPPAREAASPAALTDEHVRALTVAACDFEARGFTNVPRVLRSILAASPADQGDRVPYLPYLSDRADGVKGHYAISRMHPGGYCEHWNLHSHRWAAFSEDVLTLEQATELLRKLVIPTASASKEGA